MKKIFGFLLGCALGALLIYILLLTFLGHADELDPDHRLMIQVSSSDIQEQQAALNIVANVQKHYGIDNIAIEVVAFGPGINLVTKNSTQGDRVESLILQNVSFTACLNTLDTISKKIGKKPELLNGVKTVPAGVVRIIELHEKGYAYVRP